MTSVLPSHVRVASKGPPFPCENCGYVTASVVVFLGRDGKHSGHQVICTHCRRTGHFDH